MGAVVVLVVNSFEMVVLGVVMGVGWSDVLGQCEQQQKGAGTRKYTHRTLSFTFSIPVETLVIAQHFPDYRYPPTGTESMPRCTCYRGRVSSRQHEPERAACLDPVRPRYLLTPPSTLQTAVHPKAPATTQAAAAILYGASIGEPHNKSPEQQQNGHVAAGRTCCHRMDKRRTSSSPKCHQTAWFRRNAVKRRENGRPTASIGLKFESLVSKLEVPIVCNTEFGLHLSSKIPTAYVRISVTDFF